MTEGSGGAGVIASRCAGIWVWAIAAGFLAASPASAAEVSYRDRFELWHACIPVRLVVEDLPEDAGEIGLLKKDIETAVRARLRGVRIYDEIASPYLYVRVNVLSPAFSMVLKFKKRVQVVIQIWEPKTREGMDRLVGMDPLVGYATTWESGSVGTHGASGSGFIL